MSYYSQSVVGHTRIMLARQPVEEAIDTATEPLRSQLILSKQVRRFAVDELGLPNNRSYRHYVALNREYPVWNVVAAEEFSIEPKYWCYLVIGCAAYRGYFKQSSAHAYANGLAQDGFETSVSGASAYSTLGWFADPILPSMLRYGDVAFIETLLHEMAHQRLYVNGDSEFNEAFASLVGEEGTRRWLRQYRPHALPDYNARIQAVEQFGELVQSTKATLQSVYALNVSAETKRRQKQLALTQMQQEYARMRDEQWNGKPWFDNWFRQPVNNARLAGFSTYRAKIPMLSQLLIKCAGDLARFYQRLEQVAFEGHDVVVPTQCDRHDEG
ncbi:aminopeptidase [Arenicella chitinivorans]|uniref:aminopeptidase n=1 Tax=Arenicella chitinivorans TaxID=1329800 RepID=UPI0016734C20|nr:aminopeptidase [Arenicella chitinivorans]